MRVTPLWLLLDPMIPLLQQAVKQKERTALLTWLQDQAYSLKLHARLKLQETIDGRGLRGANPSANPAANSASKLAGELAEDLADKACEIKLSACCRFAASVSDDACLLLILSIRNGICFE
jgi:hypothetical protein